MPYNFAADSFHTNKLCSRLSSRKAQFLYMENETCFAFEPPYAVQGQRTLFILGSLESSYGDFLLVIIELFSLGAFVLSQSTRLTDGQTDGQLLSTIPRLHSCSAVTRAFGERRRPPSRIRSESESGSR